MLVRVGGVVSEEARGGLIAGMRPWSKAIHLWLIGGLFLASACLALVRLDNTYFWDDEAVVGIHARNMLATGKLTSWDGRNLWAFRNGSVLDSRLRPRDTTLHFAITAASFRIFGVSTWAGRFPSVISGLLALALFGSWLLRNNRVSPPHAVYSFGLVALSVVFLLNIRQCRYYAISFLLCLLTFAAYQRCRARRRTLDFLLLTISAVGAFYIHPGVGTAFLLALAAMHLVCHRREFSRAEWLKSLAAAALFSMATVPYALAERIWVRPEKLSGPPGEAPSWLADKLTLIWWNLREINTLGCVPWIIAAGLIWLLWRQRNNEEVRTIVRPWLVLCLAFVIFMSLISHQPTRATNIADVRYLLPILPFLAGLVGWLLAAVHHWHPLAAAGLFVAMIGSDVLTLTPARLQPRWHLPAYIQEVRHDYPTCYSAAVRFLQRTAARDDLVFASPDFCNYPLMFYLGDQIRLCCLLDARAPLPRDLVTSLKAPLFLEENFPDWFIAFGASGQAAGLLNYFSRPHVLADGRTNQFQYTLATNLNTFCYDTSRPELPWHSFGPHTAFDPETQSVFVFRRTPAAVLNEAPAK